MMNLNQMTNTLIQKLNLNPDQQEKLNQSIQKANELLNSTSSPEEAIRKANIDNSFLEKIKGYLNNPMYSFVLPLIGINKQQALEKIESLQNTFTKNSVSNDLTKSLPETGVGNDLDKFKRGLNFIK